jgi:hypothetical protein
MPTRIVPYLAVSYRETTRRKPETSLIHPRFQATRPRRPHGVGYASQGTMPRVCSLRSESSESWYPSHGRPRPGLRGPRCPGVPAPGSGTGALSRSVRVLPARWPRAGPAPARRNLKGRPDSSARRCAPPASIAWSFCCDCRLWPSGSFPPTFAKTWRRKARYWSDPCRPAGGQPSACIRLYQPWHLLGGIEGRLRSRASAGWPVQPLLLVCFGEGQWVPCRPRAVPHVRACAECKRKD